MKHLKNPTNKQRGLMERVGLDAEQYGVEKDSTRYMHLRLRKDPQKVRIIDKETETIVNAPN